MKVDILIGDNPYGTTVHFAQGLAAGLCRHGVECRLFWVGEGHFFHAFYAMMNDPPDWTCSFSDISLNREPLGNLWEIPHLSLLVDPAIYFLHQLRGKGSYVTCVDGGDVAFLKQLNCERVFFLPHAVSADLHTPIDKERPYESVFFGTCIDYEQVEQAWAAKERKLLYEAAHGVLTTPSLSIIDALSELKVTSEDLPRMHAEVDHYIRGRERIELLRAQPQTHIWGEGPWEKYLSGHRIYPPIPFIATIDIMKKSKIVLNSSSRFKQGGHERIFYALMCGAAPFTAQNRYLSAHLPELATYSAGSWQAAPKEWQEGAFLGQQRVLREHTWDVRAASLCEWITAFVFLQK